jgi:hypothetical protein
MTTFNPAKSKKPKVTKTPILEEAHNLTNGQRQQDYGDKLQNFSQIAMGWQMVLAPKLQAGQVITADDVALGMMQVKIARLSKSPTHRDSIVDVAGYANCLAVLQEEREEGIELLGATIDSGE